MSLTTGPGLLRNRDTGEVLGTTGPLTITIRCDTRPLVEALGHVQLQLTIAQAAARALFRAMSDRRLETLRHQARRKGKPGWRAIRIPPRQRYRMRFTPNEVEAAVRPSGESPDHHGKR